MILQFQFWECKRTGQQGLEERGARHVPRSYSPMAKMQKQPMSADTNAEAKRGVFCLSQNILSLQKQGDSDPIFNMGEPQGQPTQ